MGRGTLVRLIAVFALAAPLLSCGGDAAASRVALSGKVMWAAALHPDRCDDNACQATYQVRITNETETSVYVPQCRVVGAHPRGLRQLPIMGLAGLEVQSGGTRTWIASFRLAAAPSTIHELTGATLRCLGQDAMGGLAE